MSNESSSNEKTLADLRGHLFDTIAALKDPKKPLDVEHAKTISALAGRVIESAKVEVDYLRVIGETPVAKRLPVIGAQDSADKPGTTTHRLR